MIAHINEKSQEQTVSQHVENVAFIAAEQGKKIHLENTMKLCGLMHDLGKNTERFEKYIRKAVENPSSVHRGEINHSSCGGKYIYEQFHQGNGVQQLTAEIISMAIVSHHGLNDYVDTDGVDRFLGRVAPSTEIYYEEAIKNSKDILKKYDIEGLYKKAVGEIKNIFVQCKRSATVNGKVETDALMFMMGCLQRLILSILVDADRTDTAEFMGQGLKAAEENLTESSVKNLWKLYQVRLNEKLDSFEKKDKISLLRESLSKQCLSFAKNKDGIYCLPIPTGGGKTLASLRYAIEMAKRTGKEHIFYISPYLSILEQNAAEIRNILKDDDHVLEHHSNVIIEDNLRESASRYEFLVDLWRSPVILTTMVQFLNVLFDGQMQSVRRMHQLKKSVIIIDEIQSLPVKCVYMFNTMMNFLSACCETTVILCSATQPLLGEVKEKKINYGEPKNMIDDVQQCAIDFKRVTVRNKLIKGGYDSDALACFVMDKFERNMLIILNTKSAVKKLMAQLRKYADDDVQLVELTNYMCAQNRSDIINKLKSDINDKKDKKVICVSTQLIEAGVDISFQCVVRSLTGLDSIAQAAGRCNRNGEMAMGFVYMINYCEENIGSLPDIKSASDVMTGLLEEFELFEEKFDGDLLLPKSMNRYYQKYFFKRSGDMYYNVEDHQLYRLLSNNSKCTLAYRERCRDIWRRPMCQAFKTAGKLFEVIDNNQMIGLIVPYKDSIQYIEDLKKTKDRETICQLLKKLQRYTVNLYKDDKKLKHLMTMNAICTEVLDGKVWILDNGYYNAEEGVSDVLRDLIF